MTERPLEHTRLTTNILVQEAITEALQLAAQAKAAELGDGELGGREAGGRVGDAGSKEKGTRGSADGKVGTDGGERGGCEIVARIFPHLSMEDPPALAAGDGLDVLCRQMSLEIIRCRFKLV
jgi:hypothetical protein